MTRSATNDVEELYALVSRVLRRLEGREDENRRELAAQRARLEQLIEVLRGQAVLSGGHLRLFDKVAAQAERGVTPRVRLRPFVDKYAMQTADIDCASLVELCGARCCAFSFDLTTQDLDEGVLRWEIEQPYMIRHELDGYCSHLDRSGGGCTVHAQRPATCRSYDCREDPRVWIDFERKIPAPLPDGLLPLKGR